MTGAMATVSFSVSICVICRQNSKRIEPQIAQIFTDDRGGGAGVLICSIRSVSDQKLGQSIRNAFDSELYMLEVQ